MTHRHAAIINITHEVLSKALDLPDGVALRGIVGLPLDPRGTIQVLVTHEALPETAEACLPLELPIERVRELVADA